MPHPTRGHPAARRRRPVDSDSDGATPVTGVPPPQGAGARRAPVLSPLVLADPKAAHPAAAQAVLTDEHDHRVVLVELRLTPGADPDSVKARFQDLSTRVFRADKVPEPVPVGRHYMRCVLTPDQVERLVRGGSRSASVKSAQQA